MNPSDCYRSHGELSKRSRAKQKRPHIRVAIFVNRFVALKLTD